MKRTFYLTGLILTLTALSARAGERVALLVANNVGLASEMPLQHANDDVQRLALVLQQLGDFAPEDIVILREQRADAILDAMARLRKRTDTRMLFFYYSGHADAGDLHLQGTRLPMASLLDAVGATRGTLQLIMLDACQSGGVNRAKGSSPGPAFEVRISEPPVTGQVLITSSAADEQSYESDAHRGALWRSIYNALDRRAAGRRRPQW